MLANPFYNTTLSGSLDAVSMQTQQLTQELSSGLAVSSPGDNPVAAAQGVAMGSAIAQQDAYVQAATGLQSQMQVQDSALGSAVTQVTSAISLAVQGLDGTLSSSNLQAVGQQMAGLRDEVLSLANSSYAGTYLFAGTKGTTVPFSNDSSTSPATTSYAGDAGSTYAETPQGQKIQTGMSGAAIFSANGADILGSLNKLVADFSTGTAASSTQADLQELQAGLTNLTTQRSVLGASMSTLTATSTYEQTQETNLKAAQSSLVSADTATVATELSTDETQQQALLNVTSALENSKFMLFDYIQS